MRANVRLIFIAVKLL